MAAIRSTRLMRARINERLERAARFPVTLLVAPAGFGKSVALRDFLESARLDAVRYDVHREDGTLLAFVRHLSEALAPVAPSALAAFPAMQERVLAADEPVRQLSDWFAEHLKRVVCTIVIDDLHYAATDAASIALLADLIERTSERITWILAARSDVGLPVATWVAYGRMDLPIGEDDLRFTTDEALAAADDTAADLDPQEVETLRQLTEGWAVALTIALRTRTHAGDLRTASFGTREMVYRYLAEQVFTGLSLQQRAFALASCVFSTFDTAIAQALGATPEFLEEIRARIAFLNEFAPGQFRYHDLFRDFLEMELRRSGDREWRQAVCQGAALLERRGDDAGALLLLTKARDAEGIVRIAHRSGFALFERGEAESLSSALDVLPEETRRDAALLALQAMIDAGRGRFELAQPAFLAAIERAEGDLRMRLVDRYAVELVRHNRDCVEFLERYAFDQSVPAQFRASLLGTLATGYARAQRDGDAGGAIQSALALIGPGMADEARARLYHQAAYVFLSLGDRERARSYAEDAVELGLARNLYEVSARAYSVLYELAYDEQDDPISRLGILDKLAECARKGASNQARLYAMIAAYEVEVERGNDGALDELDRALAAEIAQSPQMRKVLLSSQAMRTAWSGNFASAYRMFKEGASGGGTDERRALRSSETAVYAMAAGFIEEGEAAIAETLDALSRCAPESRRSIRSHIFLALAELTRGHSAAANRHISEAEKAVTPALPRHQSFTHAVRTLYRVHLEQSDSAALTGALERLRGEHFGGMAKLIAALPLAHVESGGYALLTPSERQILQMLAKGASTKEIAVSSARSPFTVDTHIRSICRKLNCSGRREAVALATSHGWVEA